MAVKIGPELIQNLQQIEAVVAGPDDVNRLFIIDGQFEQSVSVDSVSGVVTKKEIFTVLVGLVFTRKQFARAIATASFTRTGLRTTPNPPVAVAAWQILGVDADWDDESGQVEVRIEAQLQCAGNQSQASIDGFAFHVTILAEVAAA